MGDGADEEMRSVAAGPAGGAQMLGLEFEGVLDAAFYGRAGGGAAGGGGIEFAGFESGGGVVFGRGGEGSESGMRSGSGMFTGGSGVTGVVPVRWPSQKEGRR